MYTKKLFKNAYFYVFGMQFSGNLKFLTNNLIFSLLEARYFICGIVMNEKKTYRLKGRKMIDRSTGRQTRLIDRQTDRLIGWIHRQAGRRQTYAQRR